MLGYPLLDVLPRIPAPSVVIRGSRDPIAPHDWTAEVAARLPHGRFVEVPGANHVVQFTHPQAVAAEAARVRGDAPGGRLVLAAGLPLRGAAPGGGGARSHRSCAVPQAGHAAADRAAARLWETWHFLKPLVEHLHRAGHPVHVLANLGWNGGTVDAAAALTVEHLREHDLTDAVVVAHSKGGLIGKAAMLDAVDGGRIRAMAAISTPFSGSIYARYAPIRTIRAFSPRDPTTLRLAANLEVNARITSIYGAFDPHIPGGPSCPAL